MHYLLHALRGALIGSAELVPGVSGGTIALIVGIYERALDNGHRLLKGRFREVEWGFLLAVGAGMLLAVFGLSSILHSFVENQVSLSRALFFGMVLVSLVVPLSMIPARERFSPKNLVALLIAAAAVFVITGFTSGTVKAPSLIVIFGAAALAVCALILPGVSGSLILLTLGLYEPVIGAVSDRAWGTIAVFALGALVGLAIFIELLNWLLDKHRGVTLAAMAGFMLGSLRALWPFGADQDAGIGGTLGMFVLGAAIVAAIIFAEQRLSGSKDDQPA